MLFNTITFSIDTGHARIHRDVETDEEKVEIWRNSCLGWDDDANGRSGRKHLTEQWIEIV